jgi:hypothetical protein
MAKSSKLKSTKKRVTVKDLPAAKKMSGKDMKKVKGTGKPSYHDMSVTMDPKK